MAGIHYLLHANGQIVSGWLWHSDCNDPRMSAIHSPPTISLDRRDLGRRVGMVSDGLARAGRELVWLLIAVAFCVVEAAVFVTDLPVAKYFGRRHLQKVDDRGR